MLRHLVLIWMFLLTLSATAYGAENWYQVEVLIFSQQDSYGTELPYYNVELAYPMPLTTFRGDSAAAQDSPYQQLDKGARQLNPDAHTLNRSGTYKVLFHEAWRQPGLGRAQTPWLQIAGGRRLGNHWQLEGSLRVYLESYLHLQTHLWQVRFGTPHAATERWPQLPLPPGLAGSSTDHQSQPSIDEINTLRQSQRLQLGKIYYLDHPKMGVLVKVIRDPQSTVDSGETP